MMVVFHNSFTYSTFSHTSVKPPIEKREGTCSKKHEFYPFNTGLFTRLVNNGRFKTDRSVTRYHWVHVYYCSNILCSNICLGYARTFACFVQHWCISLFGAHGHIHQFNVWSLRNKPVFARSCSTIKSKRMRTSFGPRYANQLATAG